MDPTTLALFALFATQAGQILVALAGRRANQVERQVADRDGLLAVNAELRTELARKDTDHARELAHLQAALDKLADKLACATDDLHAARKEARAANEITGRVVQRVHYLEGLLRAHHIVFDPGPLA